MIEAALELFVERGYGGVSITEVVKRSGGSLSTFYELFGSKTGLFKAVVEQKCQMLTNILDNPTLPDISPREALSQYGRLLFELVMSVDSMAALRAIVAEGVEYPELAEVFFAAGPDKGNSRVAAYLTDLARKGTLAIDDPTKAAWDFCSLVRGEYHLRALCSRPIALTEAERDAHLRHCVDVFLRAYGQPPVNRG